MDQFCSSPAEQFNSNRFYYPQSAQRQATVAVSACLMGERVRYDGNDRYLPAIEWLTTMLQLIPVCPEVGAGLAVPRPPVQLVIDDTVSIQARGRDCPDLDVTPQLQAFARRSANQLAAQNLCGYLLKSRSPSCGHGSTPLFNRAGLQVDSISGIQAAHFQRELPWLSYCEESDLIDRSTALAFVLRCRLVFDWMHAGEAELAAQHRHYCFLIDRFRDDERALLARLAAAESRPNNRIDYLTALQKSCARLPAEQLLELFTA